MARIYAALLLLCSACGGSENSVPIAEGVFVGQLSNTDALVAVTTDGDSAVVYVCGGADTFSTHSRWFHVPIDPSGRFETMTDGWNLAGHVRLGRVEGTLRSPSGEVLPWTGREASQDAMAGLYGAFDSGCRTGVVVSPSDSQQEPLVQGTWCNSEGDVSQVTPMLPIALTNGKLKVQIGDAPNTRILFVERITPSIF